MSRKKAQGHIEMILSFTLFIGFVVTMLLFFRPNVKSRDVSIGSIEATLKSNLSSPLYFFSIKAETGDGCVCFQDPYGKISQKMLVRNAEGSLISGWKSGSSICLPEKSGDFFYVYSSEEFNPIPEKGTCREMSTEGRIGALRVNEAISNTSLYNLKEAYEKNYEKLKYQLGMSYDFRMGIFDNYENKIFEIYRKNPAGAPIYSEDMFIGVIYKDGKIENMMIRVYGW